MAWKHELILLEVYPVGTPVGKIYLSGETFLQSEKKKLKKFKSPLAVVRNKC